MSPEGQYQRVSEAWKEAWQMALDHNQPADVRCEWERKRDEATAEMERLAWQIPGFSGLTCPFRSVTI